MRHDPITVAEHLRWSREHWKRDNTQPRDLDKLLLRAAETLDLTVPSYWRLFAVVEAFALLVLAVLL